MTYILAQVTRNTTRPNPKGLKVPEQNRRLVMAILPRLNVIAYTVSIIVFDFYEFAMKPSQFHNNKCII